MINNNLYFLSIVGSILLFTACQPVQNEPTELMAFAPEEDLINDEVPETLLYGIGINDKEVIEGKIKWNQTLGKILAPYNVPNDKLIALSQYSKNSYDVRKLKAGTSYTILCDTDSAGMQYAQYFIFEPDAVSYVIYHFGDSVYAKQEYRPVEVVERAIAATIRSSVYEAAIEAGATPLLVSKMVDILAWQVDFFRIQKGDRFKVLYEEELSGGKVVGVKGIKGIYFEHAGKPYYGIHYAAEGKGDYFDETGNSLRKAFLKAPLNYKRISSRYSPKRFHPVLKQYKSHLGTDYAADPGTPIMTVGDGVVVEASFTQNNGNYVKIKHNSNYSTQYLHMQKIRTGIRPGVQVKQGEVIGFVGSTGLANGPHLCFRFWKNGIQVDALTVDLPPIEPINEKYLNAYLHHKNIVIHQLDNISFDQVSKNSNNHVAQR